MRRKMWTTEMMLECILRSGIKTSWRVKENTSLQNEHAKIVALLKAFDLYFEERQLLYNKNHDLISDGYAFDISDFYRGNFIKKRSKKEVAILLDELAEDKIIRPIVKCQRGSVHTLLTGIFAKLIDYRIALRQSIYCIPSYRISEELILSNSLIVLEQQAEIIDSAILKIIGYKKPVPEKVLIKKYGFPETGLLTGNKSIEELIAAL